MSLLLTDLEPTAADVLSELVTLGVGRAAAALSDLVGERVELNVPRVRLCTTAELSAEGEPLSDPVSTVVVQDFHGGLSGRAALAFPRSSAVSLGSLLSGSDVAATQVDLEVGGILLEVGNIVLNGVLGSLSNETGLQLEYALPDLFDDGPALPRLLPEQTGDRHLLVADVEFSVQHRDISGTIAIVFAGGCVEALLAGVQGSGGKAGR
jgi:chemotaxis protein CheC